jgi:C2H2 type zinc-finger (2 copies)
VPFIFRLLFSILFSLLTTGLFCFHPSEDIEANLKHMRAEHSFFVPDIEFLTDPEGLLEHLMSKVVEGKCLFCKSSSSFSSPQGAQQHMVAKCHCKFSYETEEHFEEYSEFYSYEDESDDDEEEDDGEVKAGQMVLSGATNDITVTTSGDLVLKDGKLAYPRQLMRYYKQRLVSSQPEILRAQMERLALDYAAAGVLPSARAGALAAARIGGIAALSHGTRGNRTDARAQKRDDRYKAHMALHTGMAMNQIRRKYFRVALLV